MGFLCGNEESKINSPYTETRAIMMKVTSPLRYQIALKIILEIYDVLPLDVMTKNWIPKRLKDKLNKLKKVMCWRRVQASTGLEFSSFRSSVVYQLSIEASCIR